MSEAQVQGQIFLAIKAQFNSAGLEVSVMNRCIDIAYFNEAEELVTIEIKLKDWRKAIRQALDHQLYADRAYICLPKPQRAANEELLALVREAGIGLIWFEFGEVDKGSVHVESFIDARKNEFCWQPARRKVESMLYA